MLNKLHETVETGDFHAWDDDYGFPADMEVEMLGEVDKIELNKADAKEAEIVKFPKISSNYFGLTPNAADFRLRVYRKAAVATWNATSRTNVAVVVLYGDDTCNTIKKSFYFSRYESLFGYRRMLTWLESEARKSGHIGVKLWVRIGANTRDLYVDNNFVHPVSLPHPDVDEEFMASVWEETKADRDNAKQFYRKLDWTSYYTDGSSAGVASSYKTAWGTAGWVLEDTEKAVFYVSTYGGLDINQLETIAILNAIIGHDKARPEQKGIRIYSDSRIAIARVKDLLAGDVSGSKIESLPNTLPIDEIIEILGKYVIEINWVKGHEDNLWHNLIDEVVGAARKMVTANTPTRRGETIRKYRTYERNYLDKHMEWLHKELQSEL